jgi:hypothetical protein
MSDTLGTALFTKTIGTNQLSAIDTLSSTGTRINTYANKKVFVDFEKNIYAVGAYNGLNISSDLLEAGIVSNPAHASGYLIKTDSAGNVIFAKTIGTSAGPLYIFQLDVVESGSYEGIYICGRYVASSTTTPAYNNIQLKKNSVTNTTPVMGFIAKYDMNGTFQWSEVLESNSTNANIGSFIPCISVSSQGIFFGAMIRGTNTLTKILADGTTSSIESSIYGRTTTSINYDIIIRGLDVNGDLQSAYSKTLIATTSDNYIRDIKAANDALYVAYDLYENPTNATLLNAYINKYEYVTGTQASGWPNLVAADHNDFANSVSVTSDSVYTCGPQSLYFGFATEGSSDVMSVLGASQESTATGTCYAVARNLNGSLKWAKQFNIRTPANGNVSVDETVYTIYGSDRSVYITGEISTIGSSAAGNKLSEKYFDGTSVVFRDIITDLPTSTGTNTIGFLLKYTSDGNFLWSKTFSSGTAGRDYLYSITSKANVVAIHYAYGASGTTTTNTISVYSDTQEKLLLINAIDTPNLGEVQINIINSTPYNTVSLKIGNNTPIDLSGKLLSYQIPILSSATTLLTYTPDISDSIIFTPRSPIITVTDSPNLGDINISVANYNALYTLNRNNSDLSGYSDIALSSITLTTTTKGQSSFYIKAKAKNDANIIFNSSVVSIIPRGPSFTLTDNITSILLTPTLYNGTNLVIEKSTDGIIFDPVALELSGANYIDMNVSRGIRYYYRLTAKGVNTSLTFTSPINSIIQPLEAIIGTGTLTSTDYIPTPSIFSSYNRGVRNQVIYTKNELIAAGLVSGQKITSLGFYLTNTSPQTAWVVGLQINIGHIAESKFSSNVYLTGLSPVYGDSNNITKEYKFVTGWNMYDLSNAFTWDGERNIIVDTYQYNSQWGTPLNWTYTIVNDSIVYTNHDSYYTINQYTSGSIGSSRFNIKFAYERLTTVVSNLTIDASSASIAITKNPYNMNALTPLSVTVLSGSGNYSYTWTGTGVVDSSGSIARVKFREGISGETISVTVSDGTGSKTKTFAITYITLVPVVTPSVSIPNNSFQITTDNRIAANVTTGIGMIVGQNAIVNSYTPPASQGIVTVAAKIVETTLSTGHVTMNFDVNKYNNVGAKVESILGDTSTYGTVVFDISANRSISIVWKNSAGITFTLGNYNTSTNQITSLYNTTLTLLSNSGERIQFSYFGPNSETIIIVNPVGDLIVPCFVSGTRIMTPTGEKRVENLKSGDIILSADGRKLPATIYKTKIARTTKENAPYLIPANAFSPHFPPQDIILSPKHAIQSKKGVWEIPQFAEGRYPAVQKTKIGEAVEYYHIELPNFFTDNVIANGSVCESLGSKAQSQLKGKALYTFNKKLNGFTRYNPTESNKKSKA